MRGRRVLREHGGSGNPACLHCHVPLLTWTCSCVHCSSISDKPGKVSIGSILQLLAGRHRLQPKPCDWYLRSFSYGEEDCGTWHYLQVNNFRNELMCPLGVFCRGKTCCVGNSPHMCHKRFSVASRNRTWESVAGAFSLYFLEYSFSPCCASWTMAWGFAHIYVCPRCFMWNYVLSLHISSSPKTMIIFANKKSPPVWAQKL